MTVTLIAALDEDNAIGCTEGGLPWHLPAEAAHFREYCRGKWLLLGRRTYDEMRGWFGEAARLVLTRSPALIAEPARPVRSVAEAIALADAAGATELVVAGGAALYALALPHATRLVLTRVHLHSGATRRFPPITGAHWRTIQVRFHPADSENPSAFTISTFDRASDPLIRGEPD